MALPDAPTGLYWSRRGEVACVDHVPTDAAQQEANGWQPIPSFYRRTLQCQFCAPDRAAIAHPRAPGPCSGEPMPLERPACPYCLSRVVTDVQRMPCQAEFKCTSCGKRWCETLEPSPTIPYYSPGPSQETASRTCGPAIAMPTSVTEPLRQNIGAENATPEDFSVRRS
jgi:hypothetical protein